MPLESPVNEIVDLNEAWPLNSDLQSFSDDHKRNIKRALKNSFAHMGSNGGVVTVSAAELNHLTGVTGDVQTQINSKSTEWDPVIVATYAPLARSKLLVNPPTGGTVISLPSNLSDGAEIRVRMLFAGSGPVNPAEPVTIVRSGTDTITDLDSGTSNLTSIAPAFNNEYWVFVFETRVSGPNEWLGWQVPTNRA